MAGTQLLQSPDTVQRNFPLSSLFSNVMVHLALELLQRCSVCDPAKIFFTSKFSYLILFNPTHQAQIGTANRWETTNCKPSGPIIMMCQWETPRADVFITLFSTGAQHCCAFCQNHFPDMLTFLHPMWLCRFTYWTQLEMLLVGGGGGGQVGSRRPALDGTTGKEQRILVKFDQSNHTHHHHAPGKFRQKEEGCRF
jgi:hypothetical protein